MLICQTNLAKCMCYSRSLFFQLKLNLSDRAGGADSANDTIYKMFLNFLLSINLDIKEVHPFKNITRNGS